MSNLCDLKASRLRHLIGARALSPVELLASCRARIEAIDPALNAIPHRCNLLLGARHKEIVDIEHQQQIRFRVDVD